ncbi:hypothetical protein VN97_g11547 [Penicillium thymicola]|uniref:Uncharacterized protein n=1 Tax=Penicillium thymicola TaxID=293382 RepID=A0AAI9T705_PENTH|nr:hypothetical protein VN97_g11547 [Penicillium thymicola]
MKQTNYRLFAKFFVLVEAQLLSGDFVYVPQAYLYRYAPDPEVGGSHPILPHPGDTYRTMTAHKPQAGELVVGWVITCESSLLYVFVSFCFSYIESPLKLMGPPSIASRPFLPAVV